MAVQQLLKNHISTPTQSIKYKKSIFVKVLKYTKKN